MRNYLFRNLSLLSLCLVLSVPVFSQARKKKVHQPAPPKPSASTAPSPPNEIPLSNLENAVVNELNEARQHPAKYIGHLQEQRRALDGKHIRMPNKTAVLTIEGAAAIDDAIGDLKRVPKLPELQVVGGLTAVARAQLADLKENSSLGHFGKDGSDFKTRLARFGTAGKCGENICHRGATARDVVMIFLVDDGVKSRPHRRSVLSEHSKKVGVACGTGKKSEALCVVVLAESFKDKNEHPANLEF